jgi:O-antigen/teichoic acid export membrane protein
MVAFRWLDRLIGLASVALLARLLAPEDFGLVGYAMLMISLLDLLAELATEAELIRHQNPDRDYYNAAWTMNVLKGLVMVATMVLLAPLAADYFREPRVAAVMYVLAAMPLIQSFENIGVVDFRKHLQFDREFRYLLTSRLLGTLVIVIFALALRSHWALVAGSLARAAIRVLLSYRVHPFRPRFAFARMPDIFRFSRWMLVQNFTFGLIERIPALVIGRIFDASSLAFYNISKEIADLATTEVRAPIRRALYPGLSKVSASGDAMNSVLVESTAVIALLTFPVPLGIALVAPDLVPLFLGGQWGATVALLQPLAFAAAVTAIDTNSGLAYMATNRPYLTAIGGVVRLIILCALIAALKPRFGLTGVAYAAAAGSVMIVVTDYALSRRLLGIRAMEFGRVVWRPVVAGLLMIVAVELLRSRMPAATDVAGHAWSLAASAAAGAAVYVGVVLALWAVTGYPQGAEQRLMDALRSLRRRRSPA